MGVTDHSGQVESGPSLLFYYLFDDWYSSLELVVGRGYPYSNRMCELVYSLPLLPFRPLMSLSVVICKTTPNSPKSLVSIASPDS